MTLILKDGRKLRICRTGFYEVVEIDGEVYYNHIGYRNIQIKDIERVE